MSFLFLVKILNKMLRRQSCEIPSNQFQKLSFKEMRRGNKSLKIVDSKELKFYLYKKLLSDFQVFVNLFFKLKKKLKKEKKGIRNRLKFWNE